MESNSKKQADPAFYYITIGIGERNENKVSIVGSMDDREPGKVLGRGTIDVQEFVARIPNDHKSIIEWVKHRDHLGRGLNTVEMMLTFFMHSALIREREDWVKHIVGRLETSEAHQLKDVMHLLELIDRTGKVTDRWLPSKRFYTEFSLLIDCAVNALIAFKKN